MTVREVLQKYSDDERKVMKTFCDYWCDRLNVDGFNLEVDYFNRLITRMNK